MQNGSMNRITTLPPLEQGVAVRIAASAASDTDTAAREVIAQLMPDDLAGIIVFCSSRHVLDTVAKAFEQCFADVTTIGCTTAGEITPWGAGEGTIAAIGFPSANFAFHTVCFDDLDDFDPENAHAWIAKLLADAAVAEAGLGGGQIDRACLMLIDGLSCREELITHTCQHVLERIPLIGGSAGDDFAFASTAILHGGTFRSDRAAVALLSSRRRLQVIRSEHHIASEDAFAVVTQANPARRRVEQLNGLPAAQEYARLLGLGQADLDDEAFARNPFMVRVGGRYFSRAVMKVEDDSLVFHSAIERGLVLRLGTAREATERLREAVAQADFALGECEAVVAFESAQNRVQACADGQTRALDELHLNNRFVGFHGYGEQIREIHVNRSFSGLMIGAELSC